MGAQGGRTRDVSICEDYQDRVFVSEGTGGGLGGFFPLKTYGAETPVQDANEALDRRRGDGEGVFDGEEASAEGDVCEEAEGEGQG